MVSVTPFPLFESFERDRNNAVRRRSLRFDLNALADFEQEVGMGIAQLMQTKAIYATTRALLWAGLKHEDRGLTVDRVGNLLDLYMRGGGDLSEALSAAFQAAVAQGAMGSSQSDEASSQGNVTTPVDPAPGPVAVPVQSVGEGTGG